MACFLMGGIIVNDIIKRTYTIQEIVAYCIYGYRKCFIKDEANKKEKFQLILKSILEVANEISKEQIVQKVDANLLKRVHFEWRMQESELLAYAACIFFVLVNREQKITDEKIVKEFLSELHIHHPRRTKMEANVILENFFKK